MNIPSVWWLCDDEREQDQSNGGATADQVHNPSLMHVTRVVTDVLPRVVGVVHALDVLDDLLGPVFHDNVDSGSGPEVAVIDDIDRPDNANE